MATETSDVVEDIVEEHDDDEHGDDDLDNVVDDESPFASDSDVLVDAASSAFVEVHRKSASSNVRFSILVGYG